MEIKDVICYTIIRKGDDYGFKGLERTAGITDSSSERTEKNTQKRMIILFSKCNHLLSGNNWGNAFD